MTRSNKPPLAAAKEFRTALTVIGQGQQAHSPVERFVLALADELDLPPENIVDGGTKDIPRLLEKAFGNHDGRIDQVNDIKRFRIHFQHAKDIRATRELLGPKNGNTRFRKTWDAKGVHVVDYDDYYNEPLPHGYIGFHIKLEVDLGRGRTARCEVQLMHENMKFTDEYSHRIYEEKRSIEAKASREKRTLTEDEAKDIAGYKESLGKLYETDASHYHLEGLRSPNYVVKKHYNPTHKKNSSASTPQPG